MRVDFLQPVAAAVGLGGAALSHIALVGNALPRRCGLATYSSHSADAMRAAFPRLRVDHYAMDDGHGGLSYPDTLAALIPQEERDAYLRAARDIGDSGAQIIWVQHEFGIYGGHAGEHLLALIERSSLPVVTSLHTILPDPDPDQDRVFRRILERSAALVVMAEAGKRMLVETYGTEAGKISVIPHGAPDCPRVDPAVMRARLGLDERPTILTFGLLAPGKGIEVMIEAMPAIVARVPDARYIILGSTHPALLRHEGDRYRNSLKARAAELGMAANILFEDRFVEESELLDWLRAADIYVTPYPDPRQITSGTLSYAVAVGLPVVATPYLHAGELLADGVGTLVPFGDSDGFSREVVRLLEDADVREAASARAYAKGRETLWPINALRVGEVMRAALASRPAEALPDWQALRPSLDRADAMTDGVGMLQHGVHAVPDRNHGYCLDDNARLLMLAARHPERGPRARRLALTAAAFVQHCWNADSGCFRNFMAYDRRWLEERGSDDSHGRALWALGVTAAQATDADLRDWAAMLFRQALPVAATIGGCPRALAFAMLGAAAFLDAEPDDRPSRELLDGGSATLAALVDSARRPDWAWFEAVLAYDNARLPEALLRAGQRLDRPGLVELGVETLDWIVGVQTGPKGHFRAVGTDSFGRRYAAPLPFDQQPLEAHATVEACCTAWDVTGDQRWIAQARRAHAWFAGVNDLGASLAGEEAGSCRDGLCPGGVNRNIGAESVLALQLATCALLGLPQEGSATAVA